MGRLAAKMGAMEPANVERLKRERDDALKRLAQAEKVVAQQAARLAHRGWRLPVAKARHAKGSFTRVVIPDTHGCHVDPAAIKAFLRDLEAIRPAEVVWLGDHLDCGGFLAEHHTLGYVAETDVAYEDDVAAANELLDRVSTIVPPKAQHMLVGNHEQRIERWCVTKAAGTRNAAYLLKVFGAEAALRIADRGINYYRRGEFHCGLRNRGSIKLGACHFTHGMFTGPDAARRHLHEYGGCIVFGHVHRSLSYVTQTVADGTIGAWSPGCLSKLTPYWNETRLAGWSHGYGLQIVHPDGRFLHLNVPIIDGESYLGGLTERMT